MIDLNSLRTNKHLFGSNTFKNKQQNSITVRKPGCSCPMKGRWVEWTVVNNWVSISWIHPFIKHETILHHEPKKVSIVFIIYIMFILYLWYKNLDNIYICIYTGWWLTYPSEKIWKSMGFGWHPIYYGKIKSMFQTTNQITWYMWIICVGYILFKYWIYNQ